jgi:serpin B
MPHPLPYRASAASRILLTLLLTAAVCPQVVSASDEQEVIKGYNATALQLYRELGKEPGNFVISPYGIGTAMSMALAGARGGTEAEMARVLNQPLPRERMDSANARILDGMGRLSEAGKGELSVANALCLAQQGAMVHESYRGLLLTDYRAEVFGARDAAPINAWVSEKTHGRIDTILESLDPQDVCVLLNAVYFKGVWASPFDEKETHPGRFYTSDSETVFVPTMHQTAEYSLTRYDDFVALAMPYKIDSLAMIILLPKEPMGLASLEEGLSPDTLQSVLGDLEAQKPAQVRLWLPSFKITFETSLVPSFQSLGMRSAFSPEGADFGGIIGQDSAPGVIWISEIEHKALLEVNEKGAEAAAATAVVMTWGGSGYMIGGSEPPEVRVDHPFLFLLIDRSTNAILFMGRVTNPLGEA